MLSLDGIVAQAKAEMHMQRKKVPLSEVLRTDTEMQSEHSRNTSGQPLRIAALWKNFTGI